MKTYVFEVELHCDACVFEKKSCIGIIPGVESVDCIQFLNDVAIMVSDENPPAVELL